MTAPEERVVLVRRSDGLVDVVEVATGDVIDSGLPERRAREIYSDALAE